MMYSRRCAPHVVLTGEIGVIRLVDGTKYKGGTRVTMVCGFRALEDCCVKEDNILEISHLLSAKPYEVAEAVKRLLEGKSADKGQNCSAWKADIWMGRWRSL